MSKYIAYCGDRTWKHCNTFQEASEWLILVQTTNEGRIYQNIVDLHKRKCWQCGLVSYFKTVRNPACPDCNSLDTRRVVNV